MFRYNACIHVCLFFVRVFQIEVQVCDRAPDTLCAATNGRVLVTVIRNHYPFFRNLPYDRDLALNFNAGQSVVTVDGADPDPAVSSPSFTNNMLHPLFLAVMLMLAAETPLLLSWKMQPKTSFETNFLPMKRENFVSSDALC